jgi:hypothetical protein
MRNTPLKAFVNGDKKKKSKNKKDIKKTPRQKFILEGIQKGTLPTPDTKEKLKQFKTAYFDERFI